MLSSLNESYERAILKPVQVFLMCNAAFKLNQQSLKYNVQKLHDFVRLQCETYLVN